MVPQPLHWNRPPQSPVWQWPTPALSKTQPVRPQNRVFRLFGVVIVTLCPAGSTHPVAASGVLGLGAAATQIVCDIWLTNVTRRREPAAPEGGGSEAAGAEEAGEDGLGGGILASVGVAEWALWALGVCVAAFGAVAPSAAADAAADDARCPPAAAAVPGLFASTVPRAAQPAVSMMALSSTEVVMSARDHRARRRLLFRLPFRPNITSILPACIRSRTGDARRRRRITHFVFRIFRYRGLAV